MPVILIERRENPDGSQCFTAKIKSTPEAYHAQWKVKKNDEDEFTFIDVNIAEYKGTSNSLPCPILVITKKELLENQSFHIKVENSIGSTIKNILGKIKSILNHLNLFVCMYFKRLKVIIKTSSENLLFSEDFLTFFKFDVFVSGRDIKYSTTCVIYYDLYTYI